MGALHKNHIEIIIKIQINNQPIRYPPRRDYVGWDYLSLSEILKVLRNGQSIIHPVSGLLMKRTEYIIFDAPLGRLHQQTGLYIDTAIHLTVPLDIMLARRLLRDFHADHKTKEDILLEVNNYLKKTRKLFMDDELKTVADVIIDGTLPTNKQLEIIYKYIKKA